MLCWVASNAFAIVEIPLEGHMTVLSQIVFCLIFGRVYFVVGPSKEEGG